MANSSCLRDLLKFYEVPVYTETNVEKITPKTIVIKQAKEKESQRFAVDSVITSVGYIAGSELANEEYLKEHKNVHLLGDAEKVGNLKTVIWGAYDLAFSI